MLGTPTILHLIANSQKHAVNPADPATQTLASITTTKGSTFHTSSKNSAWIIDSGATDHMTFDPSQLINRKSSTPLVVSNANGTPYPVDNLTGTMIGYGTRQGKLYYLDWASDSEVKGGQAFTTSGTHPEGNFTCDTCELAKSHCVPFPLSSNKSLVPFSLVHSDVWGPAKIATPAGERWFVTFIDDCTCMTWVSLLKTKGEFLQDPGIIHQRSCPYTPQQNGVAERKNIQLLEVVRASLFGANMPRSFWGEAVISAAYFINRIPSSILHFQTPLQTLHHHIQTPPTPNLEPRIFSCVVFIHLHDHQRSKLDPRAEKCVFIGYAPHQKGYRCYHPPSQKIYTSMDAVFWENDIYFSAAQEEHWDINTSQIFNFFPPESYQTESDQSPMTLPENDWSQLGRHRSLPENQPWPYMSSPCCPTQEEETDEILPTPETSSAPVPH
ncbi:unnamed protein product [Prunus armeniaca]